MLTVGKDGSVIEKLKEILEKYLEGASPKYYPPVENLLDLIYEHYTENNSIAPQTTEAGKEAKQKEKNLETWLRGIAGMDVLVDDYGGDIPLWEKIMDRQGSVCCAWEKTAFEEGMKVGMRLMLEALDVSRLGRLIAVSITLMCLRVMLSCSPSASCVIPICLRAFEIRLPKAS